MREELFVLYDFGEFDVVWMLQKWDGSDRQSCIVRSDVSATPFRHIDDNFSLRESTPEELAVVLLNIEPDAFRMLSVRARVGR
ncbi:hypothetical protein CEXT_755701 [Caerostris extrusa]|uniref:Uncharacterized protein n=1 Tax=Caerostris extrusa TaxID=172846 RepID=A0AAV4TK36_CAEEX|nr:hypothetical protein CEXT_755701 [Caerostris extrusa]